MATGTTVVELHDVTVRYGGRAVLDKLSLSVAGGEILLIRGRNGSGKTTLLRMVAGVARPGGGRRRGPSRCAYVPAAFTPAPVAAGVWLDGLPRARPRDRRAALDRLGFDGDLGAGCRTLSFGNLRKLVLAEAVTSGEPLLVIDELSAGLDDRGLAGLTALLAELRHEGVAVVGADQDSRPDPGADRVLRISRRGLHSLAADRDPSMADVEVVLRGPAARRPDLVAGAADLGFHPVRPDEGTGAGPNVGGADASGIVAGTDPGGGG